jgi:hypothetical protein
MSRTWLRGGFVFQALRSRELIFLLVAIGVLLRVAQYVANRSLWIDEASLALNLIERPLSELAKPLDFNQAAPLGFLFVEGLAAKVVGSSEYVLRFFPLVCGLVSIPAFAWLARRILSEAAALFAILLFAVATGLIYYSSEVKPYETDVAVAIGLLAAGTLLAENAPYRARHALIVAVAALALIPFSFPAVLVIVAVMGVLATRLLFDRRRLRSPASVAVLVWGSAAIAVALFSETRVRQVRESFESGGRFLGVEGSSSPLHAVDAMGTGIAAALGLPLQRPLNRLVALALLCAVLGAIALLRRNWTQFSMLVVPFALLLGASAAHVYPITERTELFLVPAVILLIAEGVGSIVRWMPVRGRAMTALLLAIAVGSGPIWLAGKGLVHPRTKEEIKPVLEFIRDHWRPGDTLYVHYGAQDALLYYEECKCLRLSGLGSSRPLWPLRRLPANTDQFSQPAIPLTSDAILGRYFGGADDQRYIEDLTRIQGRRRVWFLFTHLSYPGERSFIERKVLGRRDFLGRRLNGIDRPRAHAYLYEIRSSRSSR